ncbi:hypothetical protein ACFYTC_42140 [Actinomadura nitritigenes]|uniref:hypothetical protein n=1 Tax=Actinomadura nitritigenes TaxID=134602 RepID=UPI0036AC9089
MPGDPARYADGQNMGWQLIWFDDSDEQFRATFPISREQFIRIRDLHIFDNGDDEWCALSYTVTAEHWPQLIEVLACPPPEAGKSYYIEGYATDL